MAQAARPHPLEHQLVASGSDPRLEHQKLDLNSDTSLSVQVQRRSAPESVRIEPEMAVRIYSEMRVRFRRNPQTSAAAALAAQL